MIDPKTLKELVKLMVANDLTELDLQDPQGERVTLKRNTLRYEPQVHAAAPPQPIHHAAPAPAPVAAPAPTSVIEEGTVAVKSPMVGTFYTSSSPDAGAFISVGDRVNAESVVCIIEAMKVFNEIKAEAAGVVTKILVNNGQAVEFGQPLFLVKPA